MSSVRIRTCAAGAAVAVLAGALVDHGAVFGDDFTSTALFGVLAGAVLALAPGAAGATRLAAFATGIGAAWAGYLLRAGVLPDIPMGRAIAAVLVVSIVTAVATATADRLPLWAGLLGAGALVGAFEPTYTADPGAVTSTSLTAVTSVVLAAVAAHAACSLLVALAQPSARAEAATPAVPATGAASAEPEPDAGLELVSPPVPGPRVATDVPTTSETSR